MKLLIDTSSKESYHQFLAIKALPRFKLLGHTAVFPDEYAKTLGLKTPKQLSKAVYTPLDSCFDYQAGIAKIALQKEKFAIFARCGLGKTLMYLEYVKAVVEMIKPNECVLIVAPLMVVNQLVGEAERFYNGDVKLTRIKAANLADWLKNGKGQIGVANYEALSDDVQQGRLAALVIDESSLLKSFNGIYADHVIRLGKGIRWKLALTGTPAPNDRIEYANHAVFLDRYPTVNSFLSRFFINRGQTQNRWELKPHAVKPFYRSLSDWCIFVNNPGTYGWKDNTDTIPPVNVSIERVPLTDAQNKIARRMTKGLFLGTNVGGIGNRGKMSQLAKGNHKGTAVETNKPQFIIDKLNSWPDESTIIWCLYNTEQDMLHKLIPGSASITGSTPEEERERIINDFNEGKTKVLITKGKILGFGLNLQKRCTRMIFSGLQDSYEMFHQCVSRANRVGSTKPLNVLIPVTDIERPFVENVFRKAKRIDLETIEQEKLFKEIGCF